jgi:hypothetical protein
LSAIIGIGVLGKSDIGKSKVCTAGWWIGTSVESFNGIYGGWMADPMSIFSATAFGSGSNGIADYANTPICWVGNTAEEGFVVSPAYFDRWALGWSSLEAAWAGSPGISNGMDHAPNYLVVSDICLELWFAV